MNRSGSTPAFGGGDEAKKKYDVKQFKPLLGTVKAVHKNVEDERKRAKETQLALEARMKQSEAESAIVQKELSVQLRCAGRSYQQLLGATRDLTEQLRAEEDRRITEIDALERQVKDLKSQLGQAAKPWKEEVSKRDLKILKLQEAASEQETRLRKSEAAIAPIQEEARKEIKARDDKVEVLVKEIEIVEDDYKRQLMAKDVILEDEKAVAKKEKVELLVKIQDLQEKLAKSTGPYVKQIKELDMKVAGLEHQLDQVDYSPYEEQMKKRKLAYDKLVKDFRIKSQLNVENIEKMRAGFELTLERMDKKIQANEAEHKKRLGPWQALVQKRETEVLKLNAKIQEMKEEEEAQRKADREILEDTQKLLGTAKLAEELARQEAEKLKKEIAEIETKYDGDKNPMRIVNLLQLKLEEVTKKCEAQIRSKDREVKQKTDLIMHLQARVLEEAKGRDDADQEWDHRVQQKEEGYGIVCANLAHAEGQIVEERERTAKALAEIAKRDLEIGRLKAEHTEEVNYRTVRYDELEKRLRATEIEYDELGERLDKEVQDVRHEWEMKLDFCRARLEEQVAELRVDIRSRIRQIGEVQEELEVVRQEFKEARIDWQEKERELEIQIRGRDRQIIALKNEIEFINESWEIKYNRLLGLYEQLQKKHEESSGPNGAQEAYRRARDLKMENVQLYKEILELKEVNKKKNRQIRELKLDYDILVKETADVIAEKERGMAEMVGDMAKLQARLRKEIDLKERLVKEMTAEKFAVVSSFEGRIRQLEQQIESMYFTDRDELVETIETWKRAYARVCIERDELEDHYKDLIKIKDKQVDKMGMEYAEVKEEVRQETIKGQMAVDEVEEKWKRWQAKQSVEKDDLLKQMKKIQDELHRVMRERDRERGIADSRAMPDPELDVLRKHVQERDLQLGHVENGKNKIIEENSRLREELEEALKREDAVGENWEPQIRWRDERYASMVKEHEQVKQILKIEMLRAQETCKMLEEQVRRFPNPFELELREAEAKYAQSQSGILKCSQDNIHLKEKIIDVEEACAKEVKAMEEQLAMSVSILQEVATLGALKGLSKQEVNELEKALGVDLDGDGGVG